MGVCSFSGKYVCEATEQKPCHTLYSGAVILPGAVDKQGNYLVVLPKTQLHKVATLRKQEFPFLFQYISDLLSQRLRKSCNFSILVDFRKSTKKIISRVGNSLMCNKNQINFVLKAVYAVQPEKKSLRKLLRKTLSMDEMGPSVQQCKCMLLDTSYDLFKYIDQSYLPSEFGGDLEYEYHKWMTSWKELDVLKSRNSFMLDDLVCNLSSHESSNVYNTTENPIKGDSTLEDLSLKGNLGIENLLQKCHGLLQELVRIMNASEQIMLLWQQASEQANVLVQNTECAQKPFQALNKADVVIERLLNFHDSKPIDGYILQLSNLQRHLCITVEMALQHLQAMCDYHYLMNKTIHWYNQVLTRLSFKGAFWDDVSINEGDTSDVVYTSSLWRTQCHNLLLQMPPQNPDEWIELSRLSDLLQKEEGALLSLRCLALWNILTNVTGQVDLSDFKKVVSWQQNPSTFISSTRESLVTETLNAVSKEVTANEGNPLKTVSAICKDHDSPIVPANLYLTDSSCPSLNRMPVEETLSNYESSIFCSNPWLSLPLDDFEKPKSKALPWNHNATNCALGGVPAQLSGKLKTAADCSEQKQIHANSNIQTGNSTVVKKVSYNECGIQTDNTFVDISDLSELHKAYLPLYSNLTEQDTLDPRESIIWDSYDLHLSRRLLDGTNSNPLFTSFTIADEGDLQEHDDLYYIEKLLKDAEAIVKQEDEALKQEQELDYLLNQMKHNATEYCLGFNAYEEKNKDQQNNLIQVSNKGKKRRSSTPDMKSSSRYKNWNNFYEDLEFSVTDSIFSPNDSRLQEQTFYPDVVKELKEIYAIEEKISEENQKIKEFRDLEHLEISQEQEAVFNTSKEKLSFLTQLQRERHEVDKLEQSLFEEESKKHKYLREKTEVARIKKYCALFMKEKLTTDVCTSFLDTGSNANVQLKEANLSLKMHSGITEKDDSGAPGFATPQEERVHGQSQDKRIVEGSEMTGAQPQSSVLCNFLKPSCPIGCSSKAENIFVNESPSSSFGIVPTIKAHILTHKEYIDFSKPADTVVKKSEPCPPLYSKKVSFGSWNSESLKDTYLCSDEDINTMCIGEKCLQKEEKSCTDILCNKPASAVSDLVLLNQENDKILKTTNSAKVSCVPYVKRYSNNLFHVSAMKPTDYSSPIILDTDSGLMKAGFSSEDLPNTIFPTVIGQPKNKDQNPNSTSNVYIGHEAQHTKAVLNLSQPCKHGIVTSWEDLEKIWCYTFYNQLQVDPGEHPVLLTDTIMSQCKDRKQMLQIMFEKFNVPYLYISLQAVLALYSTGRVTGTVFHSGDQVSYCVPVYETHRLQHAVQKFNLAGQDLTSYLAKLLKERDEFGLDVEEESVRDIKEKLCYVADNFHFEPPSQALYNLPDGRTVTLGSERYRTCEALFSPQLLGKDQYGIHERVLKSLLLSDVDLRKQFAGNIVLSGGSTLFPGLTSRLQKEISSMVPLDLLNTVNVSRVLDKDFAVWRGGATMANLQSFHNAWISRHDYNEFGPNIVHRRCF